MQALLACKPIGSDLTTGVSLNTGGVYCPLAGHRGDNTGASPGIIEGGSSSGNTARVVTWAGLFDMTPASKLNYGTAATQIPFAENAAGKEQFNKIVPRCKRLWLTRKNSPQHARRHQKRAQCKRPKTWKHCAAN
ncbi:hypothetical protein ERJ75_000898200 [Trypanosoma vivax]|nr:hypothetical protein ERJ75_000898200 [Trypanosoma vivax]